MIQDLIKDKQFVELEKEYRFLSRARGKNLDSLTYVVVDVETTGLDFEQHELTEIGALKTIGKEIQEVFSSLIRPASTIPSEITALTGIDNEMVKDFPPAGKVLQSFLDFVGDAILIAHNADFDLPFIRHHLKKNLQKELPNECLCTLKISRTLLPQLPNHKLHTVTEYFGLALENRHRAMGDVELTCQIWAKFIDLLKEKGITSKHELSAYFS
jgi:DNA polymerase-3 subunit alpha (Gram-positive type)